MGRGIRIGATIGILASVLETWRVWSATSDTSALVRIWTGWNGKDWKLSRATALIPAVAGCGVSMVAAKSGINRYTPKGINI